MKLTAIYNVWDGVELLKHSIKSIEKDIDSFIIVYQDVSNFGEKYNPLNEILETIKLFPNKSFELIYYIPKGLGGHLNETQKRNIGIEEAKKQNATHFLVLDCDECYLDFSKAKQLFVDSKADGSVCKIYTYFKKPTLRKEFEDNYFVPFIHKLETDTMTGVRNYPFYVDPTRRINCNNIILLDVFMHHFSYVRNDIERKIRNSSAKANIEKGTILKDYYNSEIKAGSFIADFNQKLIEVPNYFNI